MCSSDLTRGSPNPLSIPYTEQVNQTNPMRYNKDTERAINIDDIAAQCRAAIMKADDQQFNTTMEEIADLLFSSRWEDDVLIAA